MATIQAFRALKAIEQMREVGDSGHLIVTQVQSENNNEWVIDSIAPALHHFDFLGRTVSRSAVSAFAGNGWNVQTMNSSGEFEQWRGKKNYYALNTDSIVDSLIESRENRDIIVVQEAETPDMWIVIHVPKVQGIKSPSELTTEQVQRLVDNDFIVAVQDEDTSLTRDWRTGI